MRDIATIVTDNECALISPFESIDIIKAAGFKNVFIQWYNDDLECSQESQLAYARERGIEVIFAHLGYQDIGFMWKDDVNGDRLVERFINDIQICKDNKIPMVVMHLTCGSDLPVFSEIGLNRIRKIVDYAGALDIKVAFENNKVKGCLEYVLDNIKNKNVGICYDAGHCHTHFDGEFDYRKFKDRIFAVHLHDNDKSDDMHLLPFDGTIDWSKIISELKSANYHGPVTIECSYDKNYSKMSPLDYYKKSYSAGEKLASMFSR